MELKHLFYPADFIAISRPLIYEPDLPNRWESGDLLPPLCTNCSACLGVANTSSVYCVIKKNQEAKISNTM